MILENYGSPLFFLLLYLISRNIPRTFASQMNFVSSIFSLKMGKAIPGTGKFHPGEAVNRESSTCKLGALRRLELKRVTRLS